MYENAIMKPISLYANLKTNHRNILLDCDAWLGALTISCSYTVYDVFKLSVSYSSITLVRSILDDVILIRKIANFVLITSPLTTSNHSFICFTPRYNKLLFKLIMFYNSSIQLWKLLKENKYIGVFTFSSFLPSNFDCFLMTT